MRTLNAHCTHVAHKRSVTPFRVPDKGTIQVPICLGYNLIHQRFEMCDEGFVATAKVGRPQRTTKVED